MWQLFVSAVSRLHVVVFLTLVVSGFVVLCPHAMPPLLSVEKSRKDLWKLSEELVSAGSKKKR